MLTLTDNAAVVVANLAGRTLAAQPDATEGGLRISSGENGDSFDVAVTPRPAPTDQVIENAGARVYLEPAAATALDDKVLDAQVDEGGSVRFSLAQAV